MLVAISMLCSFVAEAAKVTLNIDNPEAVSLQLSSSGAVEAKSQIVIEYEPDYYPSLYISARSGYKVNVVDQNNNQYYPNYGNITLYLSTATDGNVYTVTTTNLAEKRTATAYVKVVGSPSLIAASRNGGESFDLTEGDNEIKFIPGEESPFSFRNNDYRPFYRLEVDGKTINMESSYIDVDVKDGTKIEIEAAYPAIPVDFTITVPEEVKGIVTNVSANYNTVEGWKVNAPFEVNAGSQITVQLDGENYMLDAIYLNGEPQSLTTYFSFNIGTEPVEMKIDAHQYGNLNYTLNVDDPARIAVYEGTSTYGVSPIDLTAGDNALTISEKIGAITIKATTGNDIVSITDAEGNPLALTYGALLLEEGMYVKVTSQERVYDGQFIVFVNNLSEVDTDYTGTLNAFWSSESDRDVKNLLSEGYNTVRIATAAAEQHMVQVATKSSPYVAYVNGELVANDYGSQYFYWYGVPRHNDVIKVFTDGVPEEYTVHLATTGDAADKVTVTVDMVTPVADIAETDVKVLAGTVFTVTTPANSTVSVKVDDTLLKADDNGIFTFSAAAAHNVSINASSGSTGIDSVTGEAARNLGPVYNMQGIKVLDDSKDMNRLPAGIYIVNGRKYVVR